MSLGYKFSNSLLKIHYWLPVHVTGIKRVFKLVRKLARQLVVSPLKIQQPTENDWHLFNFICMHNIQELFLHVKHLQIHKLCFFFFSYVVIEHLSF